jgi:hypothetical protein
MQITRFKTQYLPTTILIVVGVLLYLLSSGGVATAGVYADSAHGNESYGVNRLDTGYPIGSCAHCHDTFDDSICGQYNFMLFYDDWVGRDDLFCFECHVGSSTHQQVSNNPYSVNFGGYAPPYYTNIRKQFDNLNSKFANYGSNHNLKNIRNFIKNNANDWGFGSDPDPCVACHNPHTAQQNYPVEIVGGKLNTAIRRPSHYKSTNPQHFLWGDDESERMNGSESYVASVGGTYQAPYYGDTSDPDWELSYEPSGTASPSDGSDLPDYVSFCLDCHKYPQYDDERDKDVVAIDYDNERHGGYLSNDCDPSPIHEGTLKLPYTDSQNSNYVLSCLDCHEPHGARIRRHLIRRMINGEIVANDTESTHWNEICLKCHNNEHEQTAGCQGCHVRSDDYNFHGSFFKPTLPSCGEEPAF